MWPSVCQPSNTSTTTPTSTTPIRHQRASYGSVPLNITPHSLLPPPPLLPDAEVRILFRIGDPDDWREIRSSRLESGGWRRVAAGGGGWRRLGDRRHQIHRFRDAICTSFAADVVDLLCPARGRIIFFLSAPTDVDWTRETDQVGEVANTFHPSKSQTILPLSLPLSLSLSLSLFCVALEPSFQPIDLSLIYPRGENNINNNSSIFIQFQSQAEPSSTAAPVNADSYQDRWMDRYFWPEAKPSKLEVQFKFKLPSPPKKSR